MKLLNIFNKNNNCNSKPKYSKDYYEYINDLYIRMDYRRLYLNVPIQEKDDAKALGAKWDPKRKKWYIEDTYDFYLFSKWFNNPDANIIVFDYLYIAMTFRACFKCRALTPVICFASDNFVHVIDDSFIYDDCRSEWNSYNHNGLIDTEMFFIYNMSYLPDYLKRYLKNKYNFYYGYSKTTNTNYYGNHCMCCDILQGNNFLLRTKDATFNISNKMKAKDITLYRIKLSEPIEWNARFIKTSDDYLLENFSDIEDLII